MSFLQNLTKICKIGRPILHLYKTPHLNLKMSLSHFVKFGQKLIKNCKISPIPLLYETTRHKPENEPRSFLQNFTKNPSKIEKSIKSIYFHFYVKLYSLNLKWDSVIFTKFDQKSKKIL